MLAINAESRRWGRVRRGEDDGKKERERERERESRQPDPGYKHFKSNGASIVAQATRVHLR